jgi:hypothetical protein
VGRPTSAPHAAQQTLPQATARSAPGLPVLAGKLGPEHEEFPVPVANVPDRHHEFITITPGGMGPNARCASAEGGDARARERAQHGGPFP